MSVQNGILSFDGREIDSLEIDFLLFGLEERAPDYVSTRVSRSVGMGFRGFRITPEDTTIQPICTSRGVMVTFDGRLDGRAELARRVNLSEHTAISDAALVLLAFERLGEQCFQLLMGEFALVVWDEQKRSLFLARSLCGTRALFFVSNGREIIWSSEFDDLVLKSEIDPRVNDGYAIGFAYFQPDIDESPFTNVGVVTPGTYLEITSDGQIKPAVPTWHPENIHPLCLSSDSEYEDAWRQNVETAIADKLRVRGPVFSELSGGLDSSTMVVMSDRVLRATGRDPSSLTTISSTFEASQSSDESFFIRLVEQARKRPGLHITEEMQDISLGLEDIDFTGVPNTFHNFAGVYPTVRRWMKEARSRVLFNGVGGDEIFWTDGESSPVLADMLAEGRVRAALAEGRKWSQVSGTPLWRLLLSQGIHPLMKATLLSLGRQSEIISLKYWGTAKAKQWLCRPGRRFGLQMDPSLRLPSQRIRVLSVRSFQALLAAGYFRELHGIHLSHPFAHQGLINFMLSLPLGQIARPAEGRSLMRRALHEILPERVRIRRSKGGPDEALIRAFIRQRDLIRDTTQLRVCEQMYADPAGVAEGLRLTAVGRLGRVSTLLHLIALERWLRSLEKIGSARAALRRRFERFESLERCSNPTSVSE